MGARPAHAACSEQNKAKIKRLVKGAMDDFDLLEIQSALRKLQRAIELAEDQDCDRSIEYADALLKKGVVHWRGEQDIGRCKVHMQKALKANPCIQIDRNMPPKVMRIWQDVKEANPGLTCAGGGGDVRPPPRRDEPGPDVRPPPRVTDFGEPPTKPCESKSIDEVDGGVAIPVLVKAGADLGADKVVVFYKPQGEETYKKLMLKKAENGWAWTGLIPSIDVHGQRMAYFIEVQNAGGTAICAPMRATSGQPEIIMIKPPKSGVPAGCAAELPEEVCQANPDHPCCKKGGGGGGGGGGRKRPPKIKSPQAYPPFYLHAGFAMGVGYLTQSMRSFKDKQAHVAGFALGPIGAQLEFGYFLGASHLLSVNARFGISFSDMSETSVISWMATLRYRYFIVGGGKQDIFHLYAGAEAGGAMIFHSLAVGDAGEKDTFEHGFVVVGALVGVQIGTQTVSWYVELDPLGIFPKQSTFHLGLSTGVALRF